MAYRFVNREPEMRRMENEIPHAGLGRRRSEFCGGLFGPAQDVFLELQANHILPARARGGMLALRVWKSPLSVGDGRHIHLRTDAVERLLDQRAFGRSQKPTVTNRGECSR